MPTTNQGSLRSRTEAIRFGAEVNGFADPTAVVYFSVSQWGFDSAVLKAAVISNQQIQIDLRGVPIDGEGWKADAQPSINTYIEGLGVGLEAGNLTTAALNGSGILFQTWCGQAATLETGDTVASATDASNITSTVPANYDVGSLIGLINPTGGKFHARWVVAKTVDELELHLPLPWVPAALEVIYASARHEWTETPECTMAGEFIGKDPAGNQNWRLLGCIPSLEIPTTPGNEAPTLTWGLRLAEFNDDPFVQEQTPPAISRPTMLAGGEFYIRRTGETDWLPLKLGGFSFASNQELSPDEDINSDFNVCAWTRIATRMALTLNFRNDAAVPTGSAPVTSWRQFFYTGNEAVNSFDVSFGFTRAGIGQSLLMIFDTWFINEPASVNADVNGKATQIVVLNPSATVAATVPPVRVGQF